MWRKQQMVDMLKSMDMYVSDCRFQQEAALRSRNAVFEDCTFTGKEEQNEMC